MELEGLLNGVLAGAIGALIPTVILYLFRVRILLSMLRFTGKHGQQEVQDLALGTVMTWEDKKDENGKPMRLYTPKPLLINFIGSVMPVAVQIGWASFRKVVPGLGGALAVGPDGKPALNMLGPIAVKLAEGKKIKMDDFLPVIIEKALPAIEKLTQGLAGMFGGAQAGTPPKAPTGGETSGPGAKADWITRL